MRPKTITEKTIRAGQHRQLHGCCDRSAGLDEIRSEHGADRRGPHDDREVPAAVRGSSEVGRREARLHARCRRRAEQQRPASSSGNESRTAATTASTAPSAPTAYPVASPRRRPCADMSRANGTAASAAPSTVAVCASPASVAEPATSWARSAPTAIPAATPRPPRIWLANRMRIVRRCTVCQRASRSGSATARGARPRPHRSPGSHPSLGRGCSAGPRSRAASRTKRTRHPERHGSRDVQQHEPRRDAGEVLQVADRALSDDHARQDRDPTAQPGAARRRWRRGSRRSRTSRATTSAEGRPHRERVDPGGHLDGSAPKNAYRSASSSPACGPAPVTTVPAASSANPRTGAASIARVVSGPATGSGGRSPSAVRTTSATQAISTTAESR